MLVLESDILLVASGQSIDSSQDKATEGEDAGVGAEAEEQQLGEADEERPGRVHNCVFGAD
jgi:hypothetical protein